MSDTKNDKWVRRQMRSKQRQIDRREKSLARVDVEARDRKRSLESEIAALQREIDAIRPETVDAMAALEELCAAAEMDRPPMAQERNEEPLDLLTIIAADEEARVRHEALVADIAGVVDDSDAREQATRDREARSSVPS